MGKTKNYTSLYFGDKDTFENFSHEEMKDLAFANCVVERKGSLYRFKKIEVTSPDGVSITHYCGGKI